MANASITLPDGTEVRVDGSPEEVAHVLALYQQPVSESRPKGRERRVNTPAKRTARRPSQQAEPDEAVDYTEIVGLIRNCEEAEDIETEILDKRSQVNRTLLPLYIVYKYLGDKYGLTSGDINTITKNLSVPVSTSNASTTLSGAAAKYVIPEAVRVTGVPTKYKLSRRGAKYIEEAIEGRGRQKEK